MNRRHRVVEVLPAGARSGTTMRFGSGYAIADDLVLTAGHVVAAEGVAVAVRLLNGTVHDAEVAWLGTGVGDAAVLRVPAKPWRGLPDSGALRWGKATGEAAVACRSWGYPKAQTTDGARDVEAMEGTVDASGAIRSERYDINISKPTVLPSRGDDSGWKGMSGAAVFGPGLQLLGVVLADPKMYGSSRLQALPVSRLLADERFAALVGVGLHDLEEVEGRGQVAYLDSYVRAPYLPRRADMSDPELLQAKYGIVPFLGREAEQQELHDWCVGGNRFSVAVVTGDGGAGKTRLAAELCQTMGEEGWQAGFADEDTFEEAGGQVELTWPTVLVVDYPDRMTETVVRVIGRLGRARRGPKLRLLLVDRAPGGVTEQLTWWRKLNRDTDGLVERATRLSVRLEAGRLALADRHRHAASAWTKFTDGTREMPRLDLTHDGYGNPLKLHIAVLQAARGEVHADADTVVASLLRREERRWVDRLRRHFIADLTDVRAHQAVALATLTEPAHPEAVRLLTALPGMADPAGLAVERRTRITEWLTELFPGGDRIAPVSPDILAEELLVGTPSLDMLIQGIHDHEACTADHKAKLLNALHLAVDRDEVRTALRELLVGRLPELIEAAEANTVLARLIDTVIPFCVDDELRAASAAALGHRRRTADKDLAQLYGRLAGLALEWQDRQPPDLGRPDVRTDLVAYRAVPGEVARAEAESAWAEYRSLGAPPDRLAKAAYNLGTCLGQAGEHRLALDLLTEAVRLHGQLDSQADKQTDRQTDSQVGSQADSRVQARVETWTNLAVARANLRDQRGALEACIKAIKAHGKIARGSSYLVATVEPLEILARSLTTKPADRPLLDSTPDAYYPPAGTDETWWPTADYTLTTLPLIRLVARLVQGLAERIPDRLRNALVPVLFGRFARQQAEYAAQDYSELLRVLSQDLYARRLTVEAIGPLRESVSLLRRFAPDDPYYRERLAEGSDRLALYSWVAKNFDDASQYAMDAIAVYRDLVTTDPGAIEPKLAMLQLRLAENLTEVQRIPEALTARREAIAIYRRLPDQRADLAEACLDLGYLLLHRGDISETADLLEEATAIYADLRATEPDVSKKQSQALMLLSTLPLETERTLNAAERAVELTRDLVAADQVPLGEYVDTLISFSVALANAGRAAEAHRQATQAVALARELTEDPTERALAVGMALSLVARWALALGRYDEAIAVGPEALEAIASVPDTDDLPRAARADVLSTLAACKIADNRPDEALPLAEEAVELYEGLAGSGDAFPGLELSQSLALATVAQSHQFAGRFAEGFEAAVAAREAAGRLTVDSPLARRTMAVAQLVVGTGLTGVDRPAEAVRPLSVADELFGEFDATDRPAYLLRANAIISRAGVHFMLHQPDLAVELTGRALAMLSGLPEHQGQGAEVARASTIQAAASVQLGDMQRAYEASSTALDFFRQSPPHTPPARAQLAMALHSAAASHNALGDPTRALGLFEESIAVYREVVALNPDAGISLAGALADYGSCLYGLGAIDAAAAATGEAIDEMRACDSLEGALTLMVYATVLITHAQCLLQLGEPIGGFIDEAVTLLRDLPESRLLLAQALGVQAVGRNLPGAPGVIEAVDESVRIYREFDDTPGVTTNMASLLGLLGQHLVGAGRLAAAAGALREAGARFADTPTAELPLILERIDVERNLTFILAELGDYPEAVEHASAALDLMRPLAGPHPHLVELIAELLEVRGDLLAELGRPQEA
ncbi:tetratricopeptide repeat protein [Streptomyces prunicolor]|uniref:tetratricopeptide repeat protein n=1 Tax=Streptomyces prunicolor TaxID=67348 RepID=UPI003430C292